MDTKQLDAAMTAALAGDQKAYASLLAAIADILRPWFRRRLHEGPDQAEDLVQEVLIAIHTKRGTYDPTLPVRAWVYAIARYKLIDHLRRVRRRGASIQIDDADDPFLAVSDAEGGAGADVDRLLAQLPPKQAAAIRMMKIEELSVRETAERADISESDVKVSVHRGLKALAKIVRGDK